ncbi:hypothetical protein FNV43_RR19621 [Rhamnella rubrinervis]|uniref:NB-ARC domain-containing protein n=1 Tax=Rhamnella rubrinervis TaxID=2594499 RepID=A0A8K0DX62_9ROSA|nr:hypothetical protein FNV43_RR19621 [Rhamnella rubrinervis]
MDDIWSTQVWEDVRVAFPDESNGSRILITTREREVAWYVSLTPPYELQFLDENESWELLQKKVFRGGQCLPNLEEPGRELARSCRGLPLSIVLLGGILATKETSHRVWSRFIGNVNSYLTEGSAWKLIDRSMIQAATKRLDGGVKTCHIHDLVRDLCISESRRAKFLDIYSIDNNVSLNRKSCRLSIQSVESSNFDLSPCARSLLFFGVHNYISMSVWKQIYKSMKFIRVLYLSGLRIGKIPSQIDELIFLRCLFIRNCGVEYVSSSIWNFRYLETLHLDFYSIESASLPKGIWSVMKGLRYLYVATRMEFDLCNIPAASLMGEPRNLQVLTWLNVNQNTTLVIAKFPNLRKLGLCFREEIMEEGKVEKVMASIRRLESLESFKITCWSRNYNKFGLNSLPSTLTKISWTSVFAPFDWEIFRVLARQPHLRFLKIELWEMRWKHLPYQASVVADDFPQLVASDFPRLQVLKLKNLKIKKWEMEKDAMPNLESLFICDEYLLEYLPEELLCRSTLQLVEVSELVVASRLKTMLRDFKIKYPNTTCKIHIIENRHY